MKFFAAFVAILAFTAAAPASSEWTLHEITTALENPSTSPTLIPYLEHALNQIMDALHAGFQIDTVAIPLPAEIIVPSPAVVEEIVPTPVLVADSAVAPAPASSEWTLHEITTALANPNTSPTLIPYLEHALNQIMDALHAGFQIDTVAIPLPAEIIVPSPAVVEEIVPTPVLVADSAVAPVVDAPAAASSPLVQIIINVNQQESTAEVAPSPAVVPEIIPTPVSVVEGEAAIVPSPVVVEESPIVPTPVVVVEEAAEYIPVNPVDVIEVLPVAPVVESNPIDVIAVGAPDASIPVNPAAEAGSIWV